MINVGNRVMNTYLYKIKDGYVMIDTGYENSFSNCKKKLKRHNISIKNIKYIFLTHIHDDHVGFVNDMIKENKDIKIVMSYKGINVLRRGQNSFDGGCSGIQSYLFCMFMKLLGKGKHEFPPIKKEYESNLIFVSDKNQINIEKKLNAVIIKTPGHTEDSISLLTEDGNLFCGDAAMNGFPSKNNITIWIGNKERYIESWQRIIELNPNKIYPAHGKSFRVEKLRTNIEKIRHIKLLKLYP